MLAPIHSFDAIILDFDGVILDSEPIHFEAYCTILRDMDIHLTYEGYKKSYLGLSDKDLFPKILNDFNLRGINIDELTHRKSSQYSYILSEKNNLSPTSGLTTFLNSLSSTQRLAICSGATYVEITSALQKLKYFLNPFTFKHIITAENVAAGKPSPEGYLLTAQMLNISPERCLVIEDSPHGIHAAKCAGMTVVALLTTHSASQLQEADYVTTDFTTLLSECYYD